MLLDLMMGIISGGIILKESLTGYIPPDNWNNKELMNQDKLVMSSDKVMENLKNGKYRTEPKQINTRYFTMEEKEEARKKRAEEQKKEQEKLYYPNGSLRVEYLTKIK